MKGTIVIDGKVVSCNIEGEAWKQAESIKGTISCPGLSAQRIILAYGAIKKMQSKTDGALEIVEEVSCKDGENFEFKLPMDSFVTDKKEAYYLLFGQNTDLTKLGNMQLNIAPNITIQNFLKVIDTFFRFKVKEYKTAKKGFVDFKLIPPSATDYQLIDSLDVSIKKVEKDLHLKYKFKVKKIDYSDLKPTTKLVPKEFSFELTPKDYIMFKEEVDQDKINKHFKEIIEQVKKAEAF